MAEHDSSVPPASLPDSGDEQRRARDTAPMVAATGTGAETDLRLRRADCLRLLAMAERDSELRAAEAATLRAKADERDRLASVLALVQAERDALLRSSSWRLTAPLRALTEQLRRRQPGSAARPSGSGSRPARPAREEALDAATTLFAFREPAPQGPPRVTVILNDFGSALSGVAGMAVALAAALAAMQGSTLRVLSRHAPPAADALDQVLAAHGLSFAANPSFDSLTRDGRGPVVGVTDAERFVAGSVDAARMALTLGAPARLVYVVSRQELAVLIGAAADRSAPEHALATGAALVCESSRVRDALHAAGRLDGRDPALPVLTLPAPPAAPDWQGVAARLPEAAERG